VEAFTSGHCCSFGIGALLGRFRREMMGVRMYLLALVWLIGRKEVERKIMSRKMSIKNMFMWGLLAMILAWELMVL
jgi:hypothetical protein